MKALSILIFSLLISLSAYSQGFLKKLGDRTADKIARNAEDRLIDKLSQKLANQAVKPINSVMDSLFAESYEQNTGEKYDPENSEKMASVLNSYLGTATIPDSYEFEYKVNVEVKDYGSKKSNTMLMYVSTSKYIFGIEQENDGERTMIIFDNENSAMVTYQLDSKELIAIPINSSLMANFRNMSDQNTGENHNLKVEELNKSKKIAGYKSEGYRYTTDDTESDVYITNELEFNWDDSFGMMMNQFAPNFYKDNDDYRIYGMMMEAKTKRFSDDKKSEWKTKKIENKKTLIKNSDYKRTTYGS